MEQPTSTGQIIILNGAPRSGKSSIVEVIQRTFDGVWMNLGVDVFVRHVTPERYRPGIGLRPGGERPDLEALVPVFYAAMYESIRRAQQAGPERCDGRWPPRRLFHSAQHPHRLPRSLAGLPVLFVGVRCPVEVIMERRNAGQPGREGTYATGSSDDDVPEPVRRWQEEIHIPGIYDLEVDTSQLTPEQCAHAIRRGLAGGPPPRAFQRLAAL
ncbi:MAG: chloramphenicol phosphotransferase [Dehalococcoidia bacterium]